MKTLLLPIDFSGATRAVLEVAREMLGQPGGEVILLHSLPPPLMTTEFGLGLELVQEAMDASERAARAQLEKLARPLRAEGAIVDVVLRRGAPAPHVLDLAQQRHVDAIVVGSHGRTAFYDLLVGSTTHALLRKAACPVVVAPTHMVENSLREAGAELAEAVVH